MVLAYLQTKEETKIPTNEEEINNTDNNNKQPLLTFGSIAICAVCFQALVSLIVFTGSGYFPWTALFVSFTLLCHHAIIHRNSNFEGERCSCTPFQVKDICNHETWVVSSAVAALISWIHA